MDSTSGMDSSAVDDSSSARTQQAARFTRRSAQHHSSDDDRLSDSHAKYSIWWDFLAMAVKCSPPPHAGRESPRFKIQESCSSVNEVPQLVREDRERWAMDAESSSTAVPQLEAPATIIDMLPATVDGRGYDEARAVPRRVKPADKSGPRSTSVPAGQAGPDSHCWTKRGAP